MPTNQTNKKVSTHHHNLIWTKTNHNITYNHLKMTLTIVLYQWLKSHEGHSNQYKKTLQVKYLNH